MKKITAIFCLMFITSVGFSQDSAGIEVLEPEVYQLHVEGSPEQFVDVRTAKEFGQGHIEGAENIDFLEEGFLSKMQKFDKDKPLYIYCRSGNRSSKAAAQLTEAGFKKIIDLKGGYKAWKNLE